MTQNKKIKKQGKEQRLTLADARAMSGRLKVKHNFRGTVKIEESYSRPCFNGSTDFSSINSSYNPKYPFHEVSVETPAEKCLEVLLEHEITHSRDEDLRGCPQTRKIDISNVLTPIAGVLKSKNIPNVPIGTQGHTTYTYFANLFEDYIVHSIMSGRKKTQGICLMYDDDVEAVEKVNPLFEGFLKLQARTFVDKTGISLIKKHLSQDKKASEVVKNYIERTGILKLQGDERIKYLCAPENWSNLSSIFAEEFVKLLDMKDLNKNFFPVFGGNDLKELNDEGVLMGLAFESYERGSGKESGQFEPLPFIENNLALKGVYRMLAKKINIKTSASSVETQREVTRVQRRPFDINKDPIERLDYGVNSAGKLEAQIGKFPISVTSRYQMTTGNFHEVRFGLIDTSSSTKDSINGKSGRVMNPWASEKGQWTDTSIYHHELLCYFGLNELFRRKGALKKVNTRAGVFSDNTKLGKDLDESEYLVLHPAFGNTYLDARVLNELFSGEQCLIYTLSDGEVQNWGNIKKKFIEGAKRHDYFHVQFGSPSQMSRDLKKAGLYVLDDCGEQTPKILIDLTKKQVFGEK
jgi:hypothetical protein